MFESHHLFTKKNMKDILSSYEVAHPDTIKSNGVFDWEATAQDPFTIELHETARKVLGKDIKASVRRTLEIFVLFLVALTQMHNFARGDWYSVFSFPLTLWIFAVNVFHDASHFSLSMNWIINKLGMDCGFMFNTPYVWYH